MLSLERLRVLHAIATYGSVTAAADVLHVTTSAISQQMAKLEREAGQRLLERSGRGVRLTDAAELLVTHASRMLALAERAQADLEAHSGAVAGRLRLT
ncbi:MAG: LysR family transcriptional regulator, partial [Actinoallomurus sp.]